MLTACATTASPPLELAGTRWQLASADNGELAKSLAQAVTAEFSADKISGNGGCNQYTGSYQFADGKLTVGPVAATKRFCAETSAIEKEWFAALAQPIDVARSDGQLQLRTAGGATLRFAPAKP
jgi:heat shock protein HslJ